MKTIFALTMLAFTAAAQDRMAETLRKAVVEEESRHNLAAAIQGYQAVVAQFDEGRKTAATALFRLAECYRQQGKKELAMASYQRLIQEFADQSKLAEQSRTVLASTYKVTEPKPAAAPVLSAEDAAAVAANREARNRYRESLIRSIDNAKVDVSRVEALVNRGMLPPESLSANRENLLKLERQLAAFDLGVIPTEFK
jgi:hypothetical protein